RGRPPEQGSLPRGPWAAASRFFGADFQRRGRTAAAAARAVQTAVAALLVEQLLQPSAARGDHGIRGPPTPVRGAGFAMPLAFPVQVRVSGAIRCGRRRTRAVI